MSPQNSARKVNTILKCQEINDIVLSSYGPLKEGDKCLALFTPILPICDLPLSFFFILLILSYFLCLLLVLLQWSWSPDAERWSSEMFRLCWAVVSKWTTLINLHYEATRLQHNMFPFRREQNPLCTRPSNSMLQLLSLAAEEGNTSVILSKETFQRTLNVCAQRLYRDSCAPGAPRHGVHD